MVGQQLQVPQQAGIRQLKTTTHKEVSFEVGLVFAINGGIQGNDILSGSN